VSHPTVAAALLANGEEQHIVACLRGLTWADELVVLDGLGTGRLPELARAHGAIVHYRPFDNFGAQRQRLIELTSCDWIFFVDVDERVSAGLAREVRSVIARDDPEAPSGFRVPRRNYIWGRWIKGGGWWPDAQLRLLRRDRALYRGGDFVHEVAEVDGRIGTLRCALVHYNYETVGQFLAKQRKYAALEAAARRRTGERGAPKRLVSMPFYEWRRRFVEHEGWRDGVHGAVLAVLAGWAKLDAERRLLSSTP
jgi:glycosyltransferase involved in cell wall biosynthesis